MATYKEIKGVTVQALDDDPVTNVGSWSSGGDLNTARWGFNGAAGSGSDSGLIAGGYTGSNSALVEQYNGTAWTEKNDLNTARQRLSTTGSVTAAISFGGQSPSPPTAYANTETWDGTSWTEVNDVNTGRWGGAGGGTTTAAIFSTGNNPSNVANVELWDGTSWTETTDVNTARQETAGSGIHTAALVFGGYSSTAIGNTESWNGSSWTEVNDLNQVRDGLSGSTGGTYTSALAFGGAVPSPAQTTKTESWDGTSWTEVNDLSVARRLSAGSGTATSALMSGGYPSPLGSNTEEFDFPPPTASTLTEGDIFLSGGIEFKGVGKAAGIPVATWASAASLNNSRNLPYGTGTATAAMAVGGYTTPPSVSRGYTEIWDGSSWTEGNDLNLAASGKGGGGTTTSAVFGAGYSTIPGASPAVIANTETWNGSSWTEVADANTARATIGVGSSASNAMIAGGFVTPSRNNETEIWDGTSWTEVNNLNTTRDGMGMFGTTTSAMAAAGTSPGYDKCETWNGTSWTEVAEVNQEGYDRVGFSSSAGSTSSDGMVAGVAPGPASPGQDGSTEIWNGTAWTELNDMSTARFGGAPGGTSVGGIYGGGSTTSYGAGQSATEEWVVNAVAGTVTVS